MLNQLISRLSKPKMNDVAPVTASPMLNDAMLPGPVVLHDAVKAPTPGYNPHHTIEVVDELIGHFMDNGQFTGCMVELDGFDCAVLDDGIETAVHKDQTMGAYVAENVCALSLPSTDAYTVSHVAMTTLFHHRTDMDPAWDQRETLAGKSFSWMAPLSDTHGLLITCTDEPVDPLCDETPQSGASLFLQLVARH